jgi:6,7-dimethyl-8-ribityllumazine synthase
LRPGETMTGQELEGSSDGSGLKIAIVASRFNAEATEGLLSGALATLEACGVNEDDIVVARVPGSFELPLAASRLAAVGKYDAVICLGAIVKHETRHDEYIANAVAAGISRASLESGVPVVFGVLTTENDEQARARSSGEGNRGRDAALTAISMANLLKQIGHS